MALLGWIRSAVISAVRWIRSGLGLDVNTRPFWQRYNFPPVTQRQEVIGRADTVIAGDAAYPPLDTARPIGDIYAATDYPVIGSTGGPMDTGEATVFGKGEYEDTTGKKVYRSVKVKVAWDATKQDMLDALQADIERLGRECWVSGGEIVEDSIVII